MADQNSSDNKSNRRMTHDGYSPTEERGYRPSSLQHGYTPAAASAKPTPPPPPPTSGTNVSKPVGKQSD